MPKIKNSKILILATDGFQQSELEVPREKLAAIAQVVHVAAPKERRFCLPNTRFLLHQPAGGAGGTASDIDIEAREILRMRDRLNRIFARETGQPLERIEEDTHRNFWLGAEAAVRYGLVGRIIERATELDG